MNFDFYDRAEKEVVQHCNCCGSKRYHLVSTVDRYGLDVPTVRCVDCGLLFLSYRMTPSAYREFYEGGHYRTLLNTFFQNSMTPDAIESDQRRYAGDLSGFLERFMEGQKGGLLLDLGGSTGVVAERLAKDYNLDATVVEASPAEADRARDRGLAVAPVRIEDYNAGGNHYDLITLCRTVDHLLDIKAELGRIRKWLAPGGLFYVDFLSVTTVKIDHPYQLRPKTARRYLEQAGFAVNVMGRWCDPRYTYALCEGV